MTNIKNEEKKPVTAIIIAVMVTVIILVGAFQVFWYLPLKSKCIKAEKELSEKEAIILSLRGLLANEKANFTKFKLEIADQFLEMQESAKALTERNLLLSTSIDKICTRWGSFEGNFCTDEKIISDTLEWIRTAKAEAGK